ncbi:FAD/NAD(P)-binding domain-containing protein [Pleomassaria siparia CBS 279.74]|uniref:FAD/NAD(P)-binding domain-containing protein n=1 Tax=Pleomassaria siparia CBS 279.74 TaxID=1314801 RepID=A0A6G1JT41_9PLEO|nr:FAD/NAD(P)-binding domain-containing protein [Pleomassaria siparia CBS 279.74]
MSSPTTHKDIIIVGAGISGVNFAGRIQSLLPNHSYAILEARDDVGGTWDLFKYPGIRSDSDLHTFGFPWRPWREQRAIADGASIKKYIQETVQESGISRNILFRHKLVNATWEDGNGQWMLDVQSDGAMVTMSCKFLILGTGYYDYDKPLEAEIPGLEKFQGTIVHPQFWPEDLDYSNQNIVVIGSGATAITLIPNLAHQAHHVTMLQRSPGYILSMSNSDSPLLERLLPEWMMFRFLRLKHLFSLFFLYHFCRLFPGLAKGMIRSTTTKKLPSHVPYDPHFLPKYNPWEQRLCISPDNDFFDALSSGKASISTGTIKTCTERSIVLQSGEVLDDVDIVVTATGLKIGFGGGTKIQINGESLNFGDKLLWKGCMVQDVPNLCLVMGYTNASWTLGADATANLFCRLVREMQKSGEKMVRPRLDASEWERGMKETSVLNLNSTYILKAVDHVPKAGDRGPWKVRSNYFKDCWNAQWGSLVDGLQYGLPVRGKDKAL